MPNKINYRLFPSDMPIVPHIQVRSEHHRLGFETEIASLRRQLYDMAFGTENMYSYAVHYDVASVSQDTGTITIKQSAPEKKTMPNRKKLYKLYFVYDHPRDYREQYKQMCIWKGKVKYYDSLHYVDLEAYRDARLQLREARKALRNTNYRLKIERVARNARERLSIRGLSRHTFANDKNLHKQACEIYEGLILGIQANRQAFRAPNITSQGPYWSLTGGVHLAFNQIGRRRHTIKKDRTFVDKKPRTKDRHVAVEIEFVCRSDKDAVSNAVVAYDLDKYVTVKEDRSVNPTCNGDCCECPGEESCRGGRCYCTCSHVRVDQGHEITVIMKEREYPKVIGRVCRMLASMDAYVNKTCGLHVHLDMRSRDAVLVYRNLFNAQGLLLSLVPASRRKSDYCKPLPNGDMGRLPNDRYHAINGWSFQKHGTIEVRLHTGTIEAPKIQFWLSLLIRIANAKEIPEDTRFVGEIANHIRVSKKLSKYLLDRVKKFEEPNREQRIAA